VRSDAFTGAVYLQVGPDYHHTDLYVVRAGHVPRRITKCECVHKVSAFGRRVILTAALRGYDEVWRMKPSSSTGASARPVATGQLAAVGPHGRVAFVGEVKGPHGYIDGVVARTRSGKVLWKVAPPSGQLLNLAWAASGRLFAVLGHHGRTSLLEIANGSVVRSIRSPLKRGGIVITGGRHRVGLTSAGETYFWTGSRWKGSLKHRKWAAQAMTPDGKRLVALERGTFARAALLSARTGRLVAIVAELDSGFEANDAAMTP
jgi:hypothetical protein